MLQELLHAVQLQQNLYSTLFSKRFSMFPTRRSVAETVRQLHFAEAKILGFVMTNAALEGKKKYYKNYNYGYGYGYGEKNKTGKEK